MGEHIGRREWDAEVIHEADSYALSSLQSARPRIVTHEQDRTVLDARSRKLYGLRRCQLSAHAY